MPKKIGPPIVDGGLVSKKIKILLNILNCWKSATMETKTPIIIEKSKIFRQSLFLIKIAANREKIIKKDKFRKPTALPGESQKLKSLSAENMVAKKKRIKKTIRVQKSLDFFKKYNFPTGRSPLNKVYKKIKIRILKTDLNKIVFPQSGGENHGGTFRRGKNKIKKKPVK